MPTIEIVLILACVLCGLVAGLVFGFAVVVMPGISVLGDREFLRAFQVIDAVIQRGQPLFGLVWLGSAIAVVAALALGLGRFEGMLQVVLAATTLGFLVGVQAPTAAVNIPLNNAVQSIDLESASDEDCASLRANFEVRWNRWNSIRTVVAVAVTGGLAFLLTQV